MNGGYSGKWANISGSDNINDCVKKIHVFNLK